MTIPSTIISLTGITSMTLKVDKNAFICSRAWSALYFSGRAIRARVSTGACMGVCNRCGGGAVGSVYERERAKECICVHHSGSQLSVSAECQFSFKTSGLLTSKFIRQVCANFHLKAKIETFQREKVFRNKQFIKCGKFKKFALKSKNFNLQRPTSQC